MVIQNEVPKMINQPMVIQNEVAKMIKQPMVIQDEEADVEPGYGDSKWGAEEPFFCNLRASWFRKFRRRELKNNELTVIQKRIFEDG